MFVSILVSTIPSHCKQKDGKVVKTMVDEYRRILKDIALSLVSDDERAFETRKPNGQNWTQPTTDISVNGGKSKMVQLSENFSQSLSILNQLMRNHQIRHKDRKIYDAIQETLKIIG